MIKIDFLTLFPNVFEGYLNTSIIKRAQSKGIFNYGLINIRDYATNKHNRVDDYTAGGGSGLVMRPDVVVNSIRANRKENTTVIFTSPRGKVFNQEIAEELSKKEHLIIFSGHYEGIDERAMKEFDLVLSIGDYILTGGELASLVISDAVVRLIDGVISEGSNDEESFYNGLLEYPHYTQPAIFEGVATPEVLLSGHHQNIKRWRLKESLKVTRKERPDLLINRQFTKLEKELLEEIEDEEL